MTSPSQPVAAEARSRPCPSRETLSDLLDNALPFPKRQAVGRHIKHCAQCTRVFTEEACLKDAAKAIGAVAPESLRARLRAQVVIPSRFPSSPYSPRRAPQFLVATGFGAFALLAVVLLRSIFTPLPAYAQVVQAMRHVRTARWLETSTVYDATTRKTLRFTLRKEARLDPPALSTTFAFSSPYQKVLTPQRVFVKRKKGSQTVIEPGFSPLDRSGAKTSASTAVRQHILDQLAAPEEKGNGPVQWRSTKERVEGRDLVRFILGMGSGNDKTADNEARLTRPGYRWRLWVDPNTLRVVKSEHDYYDGQKYSRTVGANYEYNVSMPARTFTER